MPARRKMSTAARTSSKSAAPVEAMIGRPVEATARSSGTLTMSGEAILIAATGSRASVSTSATPNGVQRKSMPMSSARAFSLWKSSGAVRACAASPTARMRRQDDLSDIGMSGHPARRDGRRRRAETSRVRAGSGGRLNQPARRLKIAVVIDASLGNDVHGMIEIDQARADAGRRGLVHTLIIGLCSEMGSLRSVTMVS